MSDDEGFLQAIRENPDDDVPRLVYADWLMDNGDPRGEFIRCQVERARLPRHDPQAALLYQREVELLSEHGESWLSPLAGLFPSLPRAEDSSPAQSLERLLQEHFRRGFVERLSLVAAVVVNHPSTTDRSVILRQLQVFRAGECAAELARCPCLATVSHLDFADYYRSPLDAPGMRELAGSPYLGRLEVLHLYQNYLGDTGTLHLAAAPWLAGLRVLNLTQNGLSAPGVRALVEAKALGRMEELTLNSNRLLDEGAEALARSTGLSRLSRLSLNDCQLRERSLDALFSAPSFDRLTDLSLAHNLCSGLGLSFTGSAGRLSHLEKLDLSYCGLTDRDLENLLWRLPKRFLHWLNLEGNLLTDRAAEVLCLQALPNHIALNLSRNQIGPRGRRLLEGPAGSPRFGIVRLHGNPDI